MTSNSSDELVLVERAAENYAVITINRPEKRNAMNRAAQAALVAALEATTDVGVIVITGTGTSFCAGVDLVEERENAHSGSRRLSQGGNSWFEIQERIRRHPAVFIAAVNGFALGGGITLVNNSELAIASSTAEFGTPEMGFGFFPGLAGPSTIHRVLPKHAAEIIFTARRISAETALRFGIVNSVVPPDELLPSARELATHIAEFDPTLLDYGKKAYREIMNLQWSEAIDYGITTGAVIQGATAAGREGLQGFAAGNRGPGQGAAASPS